MRKIFMFVLLIFLNFNVLAQKEWTVKAVPNTRLASDEIHVSDPDGYLSDSAELYINTALCAIRDKADVFVVTLFSIGDFEPKQFVTQLFNYWGIGDAETDNGVLLLFVEDQHALEFETGYGVEEVLTDAKCARIFSNTIVPFFKAGDYESGLCAGVAEIVVAFDGEIPVGLKAFSYNDTSGKTDGADHFDFNVSFFMFFILFLFSMPIVGLILWIKIRKRYTGATESYKSKIEDNVTYVDDIKATWTGSPWEGKGYLAGMMIGLSIFVFFFIAFVLVNLIYPEMAEKSQENWIGIVTLFLYFTWICYRQNHRVMKLADALAKKTIKQKEIYKAAFGHAGNKIAMGLAPWLGVYYYNALKKRMETAPGFCCPICGQTMKMYANFHLSEIHEMENDLEALSYKPYRCDQGHVYVMKEKGRRFNDFITCGKCGAYTMMKVKTETIKVADYLHVGEKMTTYMCQHCGETIKKTMMIPKLIHYSNSSSSSGSYGRSYSGSSRRSSGGSFGGGRSGGGGYSGRW